MGRCGRLTVFILMAVLCTPSLLLGQTPDAPPDSTPSPVGVPAANTPASAAPTALPQQDGLKSEIVAARQKQLETAGLTEADKTQAAKLYEQAQELLKQAEQSRQAAERWKQLQQDAPQEIERLAAELEAPPKAISLEVAPDATPAELEPLLAQARQQQADAEKKVQELQREPSRRADRRTLSPVETQEAKRRISDSDAALAAPVVPGTPAELALAQRTLYEATRLASQRELEALAAETPAYDASTELIALQLTAAQRELAQRQEAVQELGDVVAERRREQADRQERQARVAAAQASPALKPLADENLELTQLRTGPEGLTAVIEQTTNTRQQARDDLTQVDEMKLELVEKLELPGMATYAGPLLLQARSDLPRASDLQRKIYLRNQEIASARYQMADMRRRKNRLDDADDEVASLMAQLGRKETSSNDDLADAAKDLYARQRQLLQELEQDYTTYFNLLIDLNAVEQELLNESLEVRQLIDENLMWIRASGVFSWTSLLSCGDSVLEFASPNNWRQVGVDAQMSFLSQPFVVVAPLLLFGLLFVLQRRIRRRLAGLGEQAAASYLVPFRTTLKALGLTLLLTLMWPSLVFALGVGLYSSLAAADFTRAVGAGLLFCGVVIFVLEFTRRLLGRNGLAEAHFRWTDRRIRLVRFNLGWLAACAMPLIFLLGCIQWEGILTTQEGLGRLLFVLGAVLASVFMSRILRRLPPEAEDAATPSRSLSSRLLHASAILLPLVVAALSLAGYNFTAWQLALRLFQTACLALVMVVFHGLAVRWLRLVRGSLALQQARQRREARRQAADSETRTAEEAEYDAEPEVDLHAVNQQTRRLLQVGVAVTVLVGLWLIWLDVLPGGRLLDQPLWSTTSEVNTVASSDSAAAPALSATRVVTRAHLLLATLVALTALLASRNIPGLVEVSLPQSTPLDAGARYALSTVIRYLLVGVGVIWASSLIGIQWSNVQWLLAALSVGVGFGLQELVANFISGLILLFERPVRVGDIVTIDGVTGTVTRVQMRATTIRNWDRQEYIVPNKDLITGRVLNWTLTSQVNRIVVNVGVAYASDTRRVREVLFDILKYEPNVLSDPAPMVTFEEFGDSTLNFVVRAYLANLDSRLETINELHSVIHERFGAEGIEIAFPQRDLNIRSLPPRGSRNQSNDDK